MDTTDYHCWCAVFMLPYSLNCERSRGTGRGERKKGMGEGRRMAKRYIL